MHVRNIDLFHLHRIYDWQNIFYNWRFSSPLIGYTNGEPFQVLLAAALLLLQWVLIWGNVNIVLNILHLLCKCLLLRSGGNLNFNIMADHNLLLSTTELNCWNITILCMHWADINNNICSNISNNIIWTTSAAATTQFRISSRDRMVI